MKTNMASATKQHCTHPTSTTNSRTTFTRNSKKTECPTPYNHTQSNADESKPTRKLSGYNIFITEYEPRSASTRTKAKKWHDLNAHDQSVYKKKAIAWNNSNAVDQPSTITGEVMHHETQHTQTESFDRCTFGIMLAHKYTNQPLDNYYISEKLDGHRALFYNGPRGGEFISRNNKPFNAPRWFIEDISNMIPVNTLLDGELFLRRNDFEGMSAVRKKHPVDSEWEKITYHVFDLPMVHLPFDDRYRLMKTLLKYVPHVNVVEQIKVKDIAHMHRIHTKLVAIGAEGSMLRKADSFYEHKRSHTLLKVKDFHDAEVRVIGYEMGEGRNTGRLGALVVQWLDHELGTNAFKVGSGFDDKQRKRYKKLFPTGTVVTIKYFAIDKHSKKARFPTMLRVRHAE